MKIKLFKKAVIPLMISFTIATLSSCSKDDSSSSNKIIKKDLTNKDATEKDLDNLIFVFKANIDDVTEELALTYTSPLASDSKIDSVDWGDANISKGVNTAKHTYKANKEYTIKVYTPSNLNQNFNFSNGDKKTPKIELVSITDKKAASLVFKGKSIDKIDAEFLKGVPELISTYGMFYFCTGLTDIPSDLLKYNTKVTDASYMFIGCSSLNTIPSDLFKYSTKITTVGNMFENCTSLNKIPDGLLSNTKIPDLSYMFEGCTALTGLPDDLFKGSKVKDASYMFKACTGLLEGSVSTTLVKVIADINKIEGMFNGCSNLTFDKNFEVLSSDKKTSIFKI